MALSSDGRMLAVANLKKAVDIYNYPGDDPSAATGGNKAPLHPVELYQLPEGENVPVPIRFIQRNEALLAGSASGDAVVYRLGNGTSSLLRGGKSTQ